MDENKQHSFDSGSNQGLQNSRTSNIVPSEPPQSQPQPLLSSNQHGGMYICITCLRFILSQKYTLDLRARCDAALSRLENIRERPRFGSEARRIIHQTRKRVGSVLVSGNKKKKGTWKHKFYCLAYVGQSRLPSSEAEKDDLFEAGLGEKEVEFDQLDISADEFKEILFEAFPQLRDAGGYQICKCLPNSRKLEPLSSRVLVSPLLLRQRIGNSRSYIVPLQKDLDLTPTESSNSCVSSPCI